MSAANRSISRRALVVVAAATLVASLPFLGSYLPYVEGHDLTFHLARIESIAQGLAQGQFPVRLYPAQAYGTGYPCGICYPDALLYPSALLRLAGVPLDVTFRALVVASNILTAALAFACFRAIFGSERSGAACAALWVLAPYRLVDVFLRSSVGEYLALAFAPLLAYGLWAITVGPEVGRRGWLALGVGMVGVVQSHLLSVLLFLLAGAPAVVVLLRLGARSRSLPCMLGDLGRAVLVCLGLSACFAVPFLDFYLSEPLQVREARNDLVRHALEPVQVVGAFWPFSGESKALWEGVGEDMPSGVGCALALVALAATLSLCGRCDRRKGDGLANAPTADGPTAGRAQALLLVLLATSAVLAWMATCLFPWWLAGADGPLAALVGVLGAMQFPWRLVGPLSFLLVLSAGIVFGDGRQPYRRLGTLCLVLVGVEALFACTSFLRMSTPPPAGYLDAIAAREERAIGNGEYLSPQSSWETVDASAALPRSTSAVEVEGWEHEAITRATLTASNLRGRPSVTTLPVLWNGRWEASVTSGADAGMPVELLQVAGFVAVKLPAGFSGTVELTFVEPPSWRAASLVSLATLVAVVVLAARAHLPEP